MHNRYARAHDYHSNCKEIFTMIVNKLLGKIKELKAQNELLLEKVATVERDKH